MKYQITLEQAIAEVKAELSIRKIVYPAQIRAGRMKRETADRKFAAMCGALRSLLQIQEAAILAEKSDHPVKEVMDGFFAAKEPHSENGLPDE